MIGYALIDHVTSHDISYDLQIQHYLEEATVEYVAQFRKMQKHYRPELTFRNEERLLHYLPSGAFWGEQVMVV